MDLSNLQSRLLSSSSSSSSTFPPHRTQLHPRLLSTSQPRPLRTSCPGWPWIPIVALLTLPFLYYLLSFLLFRGTLASPLNPTGFGIIIDAGPASSRIHVFESHKDGRGLPFVGFDGKGSVSMKTVKGLREFAPEPEAAGASLTGLLEFTKGRIPEEEWRETSVRLIENEGLGAVGRDVRRRILESC